ncbi:hypothetical protein [uncultured Cohaesibacter sp.]|uniref:hypothetical protein n=1 Tax=uncultured Cohaesibacter sp. TaxID=1002546 RepID=UPI002AA8873B|nr:hypothetical protein [uncultured Cohaesibacter sp.]
MTFRLSFFPAIALGLAMACMFAAPANAATIDLSPLTSLANDFVQSLVSLLASVIVGAAAWAAKRWFGLQMEAKQRESLHGAIERGIGSALETLLKKLDGKAGVEIDNEAVALVANYVVKMSPDAVKYFKLTPDKLADLIKAKFGERFMLDLDLAAQPSA